MKKLSADLNYQESYKIIEEYILSMKRFRD